MACACPYPTVSVIENNCCHLVLKVGTKQHTLKKPFSCVDHGGRIDLGEACIVLHSHYQYAGYDTFRAFKAFVNENKCCNESSDTDVILGELVDKLCTLLESNQELTQKVCDLIDLEMEDIEATTFEACLVADNRKVQIIVIKDESTGDIIKFVGIVKDGSGDIIDPITADQFKDCDDPIILQNNCIKIR